MAKYRDAAFAAWAASQFDWNLTPELVALDVESVIAEEWQFEAQRTLDGERAAGMAESFMPGVASGVVVAELHGGQRVFIDGQHRWRAAKDAGAKTIWVLLFRDMSYEQAAAFFRLRNGPAVRQSTHMDTTLSAEQAAYAPVLEMREVLDRHGCHLDRQSRRSGAIASSTKVEQIYSVDDGKLLDMALDVITECWGHGRVALSAEVMEGMALFLGHYGSQLDAQRRRELKQRLHEQDIDLLVKDALHAWKQYHGTTKKALYIEAQIVFAFNFNRSTHRLPEHTPAQLAKMPNLQRLGKQYRLLQRASA